MYKIFIQSLTQLYKGFCPIVSSNKRQAPNMLSIDWRTGFAFTYFFSITVKS